MLEVKGFRTVQSRGPQARGFAVQGFVVIVGITSCALKALGFQV